VKQQAAREESKPASKSVVEHRVKQGETLWQLSKRYEVQPEAITASNNIKSSPALPAGQKLKIPAVNGIVHEVKPGDTVEKLSESYGVKPTQLRASAPISESGQLKTGESVTVPGNVNDLLKARQDIALKRLKEHGNRLSDSLAELGSEESTKSSALTTVSVEEASAVEPENSVTLPPAVLKGKELFLAPQPVATALPTPVLIPVPTPDMVASPTVTPQITKSSESSVVIPVPTPEMAASPTITPQVTKSPESVTKSPELSVVIPVPTPEMAASPTITPQVTKSPESVTKSPELSVVIPVPTPEMAASPTITPQVPTVPTLRTTPVPTPETAANPQVPTVPTLRTTPVPTSETAASPQRPQPVVIESLGTGTNTQVYQVKPGDTLDAIARRNGVSRDVLMQTNGLGNPHLIRINQQLKIPKTKPAGSTNQTVALLPAIDSQSNRSASSQQQPGVRVPTLAVPSVPDPINSVEPRERLSQPPTVARTVSVETTDVEGTKPSSTRVADSKPSQPANAQQSVYVEKLRADILKLREEYRQQRGGVQAGAAANVVVPTVSAPITANSNNAATSTRVNPEFDAKQRTESLQANRGKRQQPEDSTSIPIEVPPPETTASTSPRGLLATAPAPAGTYNPAMRTPVGQTVAPELPALSAPDMYLPDSPEQFNGYIWPTKGVITSGYGRRWGRMHKGIDIAAPTGTPIVAAAPGVVVTAGWNSGGYGNLVEVQHPDGSVTLYAHNSRILVRRGQAVEQGQQISEMGSTGFSTGPHLHFEVHPPGRGAVNPIAFLPRKR
jgi:murein DD-endopeptidase MepM/ murein hydrolase activator NlpD